MAVRPTHTSDRLRDPFRPSPVTPAAPIPSAAAFRVVPVAFPEAP